MRDGLRPAPKDTYLVPTDEESAFVEVARLVVGAEPPPWLAAQFYTSAASLRLVRLMDEKRPTRAMMKKWLADVKDAALLLRWALVDPPTVEFLESEGRGLIENPFRLMRELQDLADRAERAATPLSTSAGTTKAGRLRAVVRDGIPAKLYCAALIAETWTFFHHMEPKPRSQRAAAAADAYWLATDGDMAGWATNPLNRWRPYFQKAQVPAVAVVREEWRRRLFEYDRQAQVLRSGNNRP